MKKPLLILLLIELVVAVALGQFAHVDRPATARAFLESRQNATPEARLAFEREQRVAEIQRWGFTGVVFAALAGATILVYRIRSPKTSPRNF